MNKNEIEDIVGQCSYKPNWGIRVGVDLVSNRLYLQVYVNEYAEAAISSHDGVVQPWSGGKRWLSEFMCRQEIVGAVFAAYKDAEMHEIHEWFRYKGASIYNPHLDPDVLVGIARKASSFNVRHNAMSMEE